MFFRNSNVFSPDRIFPEKGRLTDNRMLIITGLLSWLPITNQPRILGKVSQSTIGTGCGIGGVFAVKAIKAMSLCQQLPRPARGPLLPCVFNISFMSRAYNSSLSNTGPNALVTMPYAPESLFGRVHPFECFPVFVKSFLFSIHFSFILNIIYWIIKIIPNTIKTETVIISNKSIIIIYYHPFLVHRRCIL